MAFFAELDGQHRLTGVRLSVPQRGPWVASCDFEGAPDVSGLVTLTLGSLQLVGTLVSSYGGTFGERRRGVIVGGAAGWGTIVGSRAYHNDAGIKAILIAQDVAREVGEQLGNFTAEAERIGVDYVRDSYQPASRVLEDVIGAALWWVDYNGVTHVGTRPTAPPLRDDSYRVLTFDPKSQLAQLTFDDIGTLAIGSVIAGPALTSPLTVREYTVSVTAEGVRVVAWCGGGTRSSGRLAELVTRVATRSIDAPLFGLYRYRVVRMLADRVSLQAVNKAAGVPDIEPISQWPGVAGIKLDLAPGSEVLVSFIEGDRAKPIVTHYAGPDGEGFAPVGTVIGGKTGQPAARQGDQVEVLMPPMVFAGTVNGLPASGIVSSTLQTALGQVSTGSPLVKVAP